MVVCTMQIPDYLVNKISLIFGNGHASSSMIISNASADSLTSSINGLTTLAKFLACFSAGISVAFNRSVAN